MTFGFGCMNNTPLFGFICGFGIIHGRQLRGAFPLLGIPIPQVELDCFNPLTMVDNRLTVGIICVYESYLNDEKNKKLSNAAWYKKVRTSCRDKNTRQVFE
ncbi:hypothetical protein HZC00_03700 [Candidatus Kaiserbacteria bacterium]|nr:hypothetical protein [Candidatus Kaiserbacteria bacterium]